jgi:1-acyl-sn-glycerol-3-phosphate acyltransferase
VFYWVTKYTLGMALKLLFRPWSRGRRNMPRRGPVILASNHLSFADHFFGPLPLPRKVVFLAKSEYFTGTGLKGLLSRAFFSGVGQIPIDRTGGEASERALRSGLRVLAEGRVLGIYPEGTRSPDGRLYRGRTGVARLALESRAPVVPCAMMHTFEFLPSGSHNPQFGIRPGVIFGEPMEFSRYYGRETEREALRAVTDEIMAEILKLSGQEYVNVYAQQAKELLKAGKPAPAAEPPPAGEPPQADPPVTDSSMLSIATQSVPPAALQEPLRRLGFPHASGSTDRRRRLPGAERGDPRGSTAGNTRVRTGVRRVP